jgi:hypothetical protein
MDHDFTNSGADRYDRDNVKCTDIDGVMDYGSRPSVDKFSTCSKQDFKDFYNSVLGQNNGIFCMAQDCCKNYDLYLIHFIAILSFSYYKDFTETT